MRAASTVRDRLSSDNWRLLNQLSETLIDATSPVGSLADALELLDHAIIIARSPSAASRWRT